MREEKRAVSSLPDRLAHVFMLNGKMDSTTSAPSVLEANPKDTREDSVEYQLSDDGTGSRFPDYVSSCRSTNDSSAVSIASRVSTLTSEPLHERQKDSKAIDLSLKYLNGLSKDHAKSDTSLMPGIRYKDFNDFTYSGLLMSKISKKMDRSGSKLMPAFTMRPGAKIDQMLRESKAREITNLQYTETLLQKSAPVQDKSRSSPSRIMPRKTLSEHF
jgi:hypothetical protein